jgi:hypothetical protein
MQEMVIGNQSFIFKDFQSFEIQIVIEQSAKFALDKTGRF